jgi:hypothetical protein
MKIVIIARAIYPLLSPRAFRATELAKQFAKLDHDVTLYAVLGKFDYTEFTATTGVKVKPIKTHLSTSNSDGKMRYTFLDKIAFHAFRKLIEYPDVEFCWKIPQILRKEQNVDLLITVAFPHPIHWGAAFAKKILGDKFPAKWVSDCGDPYMGDTVNKHFGYFQIVEDFWGSQTDFVTVPMDGARAGYSPKIQNKIRVIPQGFDFSEVKLLPYEPNPIPHFAYVGQVYPGYRDPTTFLEYLSSRLEDFRFSVFGASHFYEPFKKRLGEKLVLYDYIPRSELIEFLSQQDFLINLTNENSIQSPSKLIDYLLSRRPIIDVSTPFNEYDIMDNAFKGEVLDMHKGEDVSRFDVRKVADAFLSL